MHDLPSDPDLHRPLPRAAHGGARASRREGWFLGLLALGVPLTRMPFHGNFLYHSDSINFALALDRFDLAAHQPHPPGYILFVGLGKIIHHVLPDANLALVATANLFEIAAASFFFLLARTFFPFAIAAAGTVLFASQPF